ncbi:MAG: hypothetical protein ACTSRG_17095 [Candidatus Helarchaeota archaeon]
MKKSNMVSAVSDSDIFIHLAKLNQLSLLLSQFTTIHVSDIIEKETITQGIELEKDDALLIKDFFTESLISVEKVRKKEVQTIISKYNIHIGEASVLYLARKYNISYFLANEPKIRRIAIKENFKVTGTIGIILKAYNINILSKLVTINLLNHIQKSPEIFRIHPNLIRKVLEKIF